MVTKKDFVRGMKEDMYNRFMDDYDKMRNRADKQVKKIEELLDYKITFYKIDGKRTLIPKE